MPSASGGHQEQNVVKTFSPSDTGINALVIPDNGAAATGGLDIAGLRRFTIFWDVNDIFLVLSAKVHISISIQLLDLNHTTGVKTVRFYGQLELVHNQVPIAPIGGAQGGNFVCFGENSFDTIGQQQSNGLVLETMRINIANVSGFATPYSLAVQGMF